MRRLNTQNLKHLKRMMDELPPARNDPSQFIEYVFTDSQGLALRQAPFHMDIQRFLSAHAKALIELPRDHGKTTQLCGRLLWELGRNPALRVKLVCATEAMATERSRYLREQIAHNRRLRIVFPHLRPAWPWAAEAFTIRRPAEVIGPSVAAFGVGSGSTGARADLLICDDIVDVRSLHSAGDRLRVKDYFNNNLMNLLEPDGRFWGLCTPWHQDDVNHHLKCNPSYAVFRKAVGDNFEPIWPEKWSREKLQERYAEIGEASFARGYRLVTVNEGEVLIRPEWVQFHDGERQRDDYEQVVLAVDPAVSGSAKADASALVVMGRWQQELHVLQALARRVKAPELITWIDSVERQCQPDVILFESNAAFAGLRDLLIQRTRFGAKVQGRAATRNKDSRISALSVPIQNGCVRLLGRSRAVDAAQRELYSELTTYPFAAHDDLADACAAAVEHLLSRNQPRLWI